MKKTPHEIAALAKQYCEAHIEDYEAMLTSDSMDIDAEFMLLCQAVLPPKGQEKEKLPCNCTIAPEDPMGSSVFWNPFNKVVQCHKCGISYLPNNK